MWVFALRVVGRFNGYSKGSLKWIYPTYFPVSPRTPL